VRDLLQVQCLLFGRNLLQQLVKHAFDLSSIDPRRGNLHRYAARAEWLDLKAITPQFIGNFREHCLLPRREFQD